MLIVRNVGTHKIHNAIDVQDFIGCGNNKIIDVKNIVLMVDMLILNGEVSTYRHLHLIILPVDSIDNVNYVMLIVFGVRILRVIVFIVRIIRHY